MKINKSYKELLKNQFLTEVKAIPKTKIIKKKKTKTFRTIAVVILRVRPVLVFQGKLYQALNFVQLDVFSREGPLPTLLRSPHTLV